MKTIEQKAKAYDNLLVRLQEAKVDNDVCDDRYCCVIDEIVPELKESEDERIRKSLLEYLHTLPNHFSHNGSLVIDWIAWLEKQSKQKIADKVEPKFHEGEWIIRSAEGFKHNTYLVKEVKDYYACEDLKGQRVTFTLNDVHKNFKLWDISDVKDCDILAVEPRNDYLSPFIAIYKERGLDFFNSHCFISFDGKFNESTTGHDVRGTHPATKEQRKQLEKAMADAGYTFDFKKKELKKIAQNPVIDMKTPEESLGIDFGTYNKIVDECVYGEQTPAWSGKDEEMLNLIIARLHSHPNVDLEEYSKEYDWLNYNLKSLRHQKQWNPSDLPHWKKSTLSNDNTTGFNGDYFCHKGYYINYKELFEKLPKDN